MRTKRPRVRPSDAKTVTKSPVPAAKSLPPHHHNPASAVANRGLARREPVPNPTVSAERTSVLSPAQKIAVARFSSGTTQTDAARAAGVSRMTRHRWLHQDADFIAAFNTWQQDVITNTHARLLAGVGDAVDAVLAAVRAGDAKLAWTFLQAKGFATPAIAGPTDAAEVRRRQDPRKIHKRATARKERNQILFDAQTTIDEFPPAKPPT